MRHAHAHVDDMPCATCHAPCATCHASYYTTFLLPTNALPYLLQGLLHHLPPTLLRLTCLTCYKVVDLGHARELPEHHLPPSFLSTYLSIYTHGRRPGACTRPPSYYTTFLLPTSYLPIYLYSRSSIWVMHASCLRGVAPTQCWVGPIEYLSPSTLARVP